MQEMCGPAKKPAAVEAVPTATATRNDKAGNQRRLVASSKSAASRPASFGMRLFSIETLSEPGCSRRMANAILTTQGAHNGGMPSQTHSTERMSFTSSA
jgi:hypothetical protein